MAGSINIISLLGRVGKDPSVRSLNNGTKVASVTVATTENWKDKDGNKKESMQWHTVEAWGSLADILEKYVKKGDQLYVSGKMVYDQYEKDGVKHTTAKVKAENVVLLGGKKSENAPADPQPSDNDNGDDLPF